MRIAVTGAAGFIGKAVVAAALARGHAPVAVVRAAAAFPDGVEVRAVGDLEDATAQARAVEGCDAVIHLAGRVRVLRSERARADDILLRANAGMTEGLAEAAARAGCRRFVLASSFSVYGSATADGVVLTEETPPAPATAYGRSKAAAEQRLAAVAARTGLSAISLRPPAVYGPGVASSFTTLMKVVARGLPLPLVGVKNRRSFVYVGNLADAFVVAAESEAAGVFLVTDSPPVSSAEMARAIAAALGVKARLLPAPMGLMRAAAGLIGAGPTADSLLGSMAADGSRFAQATGWRPGVTPDDAMAITARALRT